MYHADTVTECAPAVFDEHGALANFDDAVGELVNTHGVGGFTGYYNDPMRRPTSGCGTACTGRAIWPIATPTAGSTWPGGTADWMRVDGENMAAGPIERVLQRLPGINHVAVYAVPDEHVGDQVMAADRPRTTESTLSPEQFEEFLASQPDLSPKAWPRYVRINDALPQTATNKILKRALIAEGVTPGGGVLWERDPRGRSYAAT